MTIQDFIFLTEIASFGWRFAVLHYHAKTIYTAPGWEDPLKFPIGGGQRK